MIYTFIVLHLGSIFYSLCDIIANFIRCKYYIENDTTTLRHKLMLRTNNHETL